MASWTVNTTWTCLDERNEQVKSYSSSGSWFKSTLRYLPEAMMHVLPVCFIGESWTVTISNRLLWRSNQLDRTQVRIYYKTLYAEQRGRGTAMKSAKQIISTFRTLSFHIRSGTEPRIFSGWCNQISILLLLIFIYFSLIMTSWVNLPYTNCAPAHMNFRYVQLRRVEESRFGFFYATETLHPKISNMVTSALTIVLLLTSSVYYEISYCCRKGPFSISRYPSKFRTEPTNRRCKRLENQIPCSKQRTAQHRNCYTTKLIDLGKEHSIRGNANLEEMESDADNVLDVQGLHNTGSHTGWPAYVLCNSNLQQLAKNGRRSVGSQ